jgi:hypothetical protein
MWCKTDAGFNRDRAISPPVPLSRWCAAVLHHEKKRLAALGVGGRRDASPTRKMDGGYHGGLRPKTVGFDFQQEKSAVSVHEPQKYGGNRPILITHGLTACQACGGSASR